MRIQTLVPLMSVLAAGLIGSPATAGERPEIQKIHEAELGAIEDFYGKPVTATDILVARNVPAPEAAQSFVKAATEFSRCAS